MIELTSLHIYPIKSCAGFSLTEMEVGPRGPLYDREWMIIDENAKFLTQRQHPRMALIKVHLGKNELEISGPEHSPIQIPLNKPHEKDLEVEVWSDKCQAHSEGAEAEKWLTSFLGRPSRLVRMKSNFKRLLPAKYEMPKAHTGFADSLPFLLISEESLADLNSRIGQQLEMNRFRPNLVICGGGAYAEDTWKRLRIGAIEFEIKKPCTRCSITTVDQATAETGKEPLKTLATYRRDRNKIFFGQHPVHLNLGHLKVGDALTVL